ncbi:23S rRNA (adenine(2503)-C(2))-methyltransferase RlmN [Natronospora cellulosivora (SeqCode)]
MKKKDFKSLTRKELINWFKKEGYPAFRAKQVFNWIYKNGVDDFNQMTNLPAKLQKDLAEKASLDNLSLYQALSANDGTAKYLWELSDSDRIESVYIPFPEEGRHSICVSSQLGCAMDCQFCATAKGGLERNLTTGEIVDQIMNIQKLISKKEYGKPRISNLVFMGMGEPLANLDNVLKAIEIFNDKEGLDIGMRKITISTAGLVPQIKRLAEESLQAVLAISLNAPNNFLRSSLMPINDKYPIEKLIETAKYYIEKTSRRISFEYVLIDNLNDSIELAEELARLLKGMLCHVNLIPLNPVDEFNFKSPSKKTVNDFRDVLQSKGIETTIRQERGKRIEAACGQLRHLYK